jgi:hypothetical protein
MNYSTIFLSVLLLTLTSCTKVIELDLKNTEKQVVIEGTVTDQPGPQTVRVGVSAGFYESGIGEVISNATVTLSDNNSTPESLTYVGNGLYQTRNIKGVAGHTYTLTVTANGRQYVAQSTLPASVSLDRLTTENMPFGSGKSVYANFTDPAGVKNYYRWVLTVNGKKQNDVFVFDDRLNDGRTTRQALRSTNNNADEIKTGDRVSVEMQCLDPVLYEYFRGLAQVVGSDQAATPANPTTNLSGGALGYFSATSVSTQQLTVP